LAAEFGVRRIRDLYTPIIPISSPNPPLSDACTGAAFADLCDGDGRDFHDVEAELEQARGGFMAQVVKAQVLDAGAVHGADVGAFDRFGSEPGNT